MARVVVPGEPHHITHRGNLRADVFLGQSERELYLRLVAECAGSCGAGFVGSVADCGRPISRSGGGLVGLACGRFARRLEAQLGRLLAPQKRGPKPKRTEAIEKTKDVFGEL